MVKFVIKILILFLMISSIALAQDKKETILNKFTHKENKISRQSLHYIEHNSKVAQKIFEKRCTECHTKKKALSLRAYKIWKNGLTYMHDKSNKWLNDKEARLIFLHMVIHLEPEIKEAILKEKKEKNQINWWIFFTYFTGFITIFLMLITFSIAWNKKLRKKYFKKHKMFGQLTVLMSIIHGLYSFYIFVIR